MGLLRWLFGNRKTMGIAKAGSLANDALKVRVRYHCYSDHVDLAGVNIFGLTGASRDYAATILPFLVTTVAMGEQEFRADEVTAAMIGEIADEVHEFENAWQGTTRIKRFLLRSNEVIEILLGN